MNQGFSFVRPDRPRSALLLHGLASSPWELGPLASFLDSHGWNASAPLLVDLKQHEHDDFRSLSPSTWLEPAGKALDALSSVPGTMVIIGTSMGGIIASLLAARNPRIDALVMANPPFRYRNPLLRLALRLPLRLKGFRLAPPPGHEDEYFPYFPFRCLKILRDMAEAALESAPEVRQPLLVFSSKRDRSVDPGGTRRFLDAAGSKEKNIRILPSAPHSPFAPYHKNNALVFEEILSFLTRL